MPSINGTKKVQFGLIGRLVWDGNGGVRHGYHGGNNAYDGDDSTFRRRPKIIDDEFFEIR